MRKAGPGEVDLGSLLVEHMPLVLRRLLFQGALQEDQFPR